MKQALAGQEFSVTADQIELLGKSYDRATKATVVVATDTQNANRVYLWIRAPKNIETFAPRLLHYGKYGVLAFEGKTSLLKAQWPVLNSPLVREFP
jgi:hypothetical protein